MAIVLSIHKIDNQVWLLTSQAQEINNFGSQGHTFTCWLVTEKKYCAPIVFSISKLFTLYIYIFIEKAWNMTLPGFGGDEIKNYRKQVRMINLYNTLVLVCFVLNFIILACTL